VVSEPVPLTLVHDGCQGHEGTCERGCLRGRRLKITAMSAGQPKWYAETSTALESFLEEQLARHTTAPPVRACTTCGENAAARRVPPRAPSLWARNAATWPRLRSPLYWKQPPQSGPFEARRTASSVAVILVNAPRSLAVRSYRARSPEVSERSAGPPSHPAAGIARPPVTPNWPVSPNDQHDRTHPHRPCLSVRRPATLPPP